MTGAGIVALAVCVPVGLLVAGLFLHCLVDEHTLLPRGLRWLPPAWDRVEDRLELTFRGVDPFLFTPRRIRYLEGLDERFRNALKLYGAWPEWTGKDDVHGHWVAWGREIATCSCGYVDECGIWCGDGHMTGHCPDRHERIVKL